MPKTDSESRRLPWEAELHGMHCAGCVHSIEQAVRRVEDVEDAAASLATGRLSVWLAEGNGPDDATRSRIAEAVEKAGPYRLGETAGSGAARTDAEGGEDHSAHGVPSGRAAATALVLAAATYAASAGSFGAGSIGRTLQLALCAVVMGRFGRPFLSALWTALRYRSFGMDSLIGLGAGAAFVASVVGFVAGPGNPLFFHTAAIVVAFVVLGRHFEGRARGRASNALRRLLTLAPRTANRVADDGSVAAVPVDEVRVGERILIRPGERAPLDGVVVRGGTSMDESLVTGESLPVDRVIGDPVVGGAMNRAGAVEVEVSRESGETTVAGIAAAVRRAQAEKVPIQRIADRVASVLVPAVMVAAVLAVGVWLVLGYGPAFAVARGVALVIVACPCAIGLAAPIAVLVATGESARLGVLFRSGAALEGLAAARVVALDKTGTLTTGAVEVESLHPAAPFAEEDLLRIAASAERDSEHPLGAALVRHARERGVGLPPLREFEAIPGRGARAVLDSGENVWIGSRRLATERGVPEDALDAVSGGRIFVIADDRFVGSARFRDPLRPEAVDGIRRLAADGLPTALLSGDDPEAVRDAASRAGIGSAAGGLLPEEKLAEVDRLRGEFGSVVMVGDGINDAPALARADVGIAIGPGADIAREAADVTLMRADLTLISKATRTARRALRVIRQNLFWAFAYNAAALPLAAGVLYPWTGLLLPPEAAAAAMALSSLSVVGNALRLARPLSERAR